MTLDLASRLQHSQFFVDSCKSLQYASLQSCSSVYLDRDIFFGGFFIGYELGLNFLVKRHGLVKLFFQDCIALSLFNFLLNFIIVQALVNARKDSRQKSSMACSNFLPGHSFTRLSIDQMLRNSYNPARWFKQIKRTVSLDVTTRFNPNQQSTTMNNSHVFNGRNTTIN